MEKPSKPVGICRFSTEDEAKERPGNEEGQVSQSHIFAVQGTTYIMGIVGRGRWPSWCPVPAHRPTSRRSSPIAASGWPPSRCRCA